MSWSSAIAHLREHQSAAILAIFLLGQIIGWRLWLRHFPSPAGRRLVHLAFALLNLGWLHLFTILVLAPRAPGALFAWVDRPGLAWQLMHVLVILPGAALASVALGLTGLLPRRRPRNSRPGPAPAAGRREFIKLAGAAGLLAPIGLAGGGLLAQGRPPRVNRQVLAVPGLPARLDGLVIAQLSDLHLGMWSSQEEVLRAVRLTAAERPHLVVLTGDLVDRNPEFARLYYEPLRLLEGTPHGVWGVLGNHDHYAGPERIAALLDGRGLSVLGNRRINLPGLPLSLTGLDDQGAGLSWLGANPKTDPDVLDLELVKGPPPRPGDFSILLNHRPEGFGQAARAGYGLYLAGHTHGGQYQLPWDSQVNVAAAFYKYTSGLYREYGSWLNVSRGLASVGLPFRLWAWPEINLLTLRAAPGA